MLINAIVVIYGQIWGITDLELEIEQHPAASNNCFFKEFMNNVNIFIILMDYFVI